MEEIKLQDVFAEVLLSYKNVLSVILDFYMGQEVFDGIGPREIAKRYLSDSRDPTSPRVRRYNLRNMDLGPMQLRYGIFFEMKTLSGKSINVNLSVGDFGDEMEFCERFRQLYSEVEMISLFSPESTRLTDMKTIWIVCDSPKEYQDSTYFEKIDVHKSGRKAMHSGSENFYATFLGEASQHSLEFYDFLYNYLKGDMALACEYLESRDTLEITDEQLEIMLLYDSIRHEHNQF